MTGEPVRRRRVGRAAAVGIAEPFRDAVGTGTLAGRAARLRSRAWLIVQIALGASLGWFVAHDLLGHPLPFFAPITAMICLGLTYGDRLRRIVELTIGVAIGIAVGDLVVHQVGTGVWQIFVVTVVAMSLAVLAGAGQLLMMQAGVQGVVVTVLVASEGQAVGRWIDALVGGSAALLIAVLAPVRSTALRPRERAIDLIGTVAEILTDTAQALRARDVHRAAAALDRGRELTSELEALQTATAEARAIVRLAPLLSGSHRRQVAEIEGLLVPLDYAIRNVRVLARRAEVAVLEDEMVPGSYIDLVAALAGSAAAVREQLVTRQPLSHAQDELVALAEQSTGSHPQAGLSAEVMRAQVRSTVVDLLVISGMPLAEARRRVPPSRDDLDPLEDRGSSS